MKKVEIQNHKTAGSSKQIRLFVLATLYAKLKIAQNEKWTPLFSIKKFLIYESQKREKIHISYIVHPRKISLTESRGSRSFFILKSGVHFSF